jgi:hypothetical protein
VFNSSGRIPQGVAKVERPFGGHQLSWLQAVDDLVVPVLLQAELYDTFVKDMAVGGDPNGHRAVALPDYAIDRDRG